MKPLHPAMLAGTGSDVGKSLIATGLCRIFKQDGYNPAPFKAQNMALNSYATPDGFEIGRAQATQAEAAGVPCSPDMNPLLLKPSGECTSQVVLNGRPIGNRNAYDYFRPDGREWLRNEVHKAYDRLAARFNPIVMEGAGSIAELNLLKSDIVNMSMAKYAGADVILVADIDRGGVFASTYGSIMLQPDNDRNRIKGIIVNKFRGDIRLFDDGRKIIEHTCGVPVLGVVPYFKDIEIDEEDSVSLTGKSSSAVAGKINVAVVKLPHISNFTDFDVLGRIGKIHLYYSDKAEELDKADIIIIPGTKSTISDFTALKRQGITEVILSAHSNGKRIIGICGGYQMLGAEISDPNGIEGEVSSISGLGLLPISTILTDEKTTRQVKFNFGNDNSTCTGYEIHMGRTSIINNSYGHPLNTLSDGTADGYSDGKNCMGTYIHGFLDNKPVISHILTPFINEIDIMDSISYKERQYDLLAENLRKSLNIDLLYKIMERDD